MKFQVFTNDGISLGVDITYNHDAKTISVALQLTKWMVMVSYTWGQ